MSYKTNVKTLKLPGFKFIYSRLNVLNNVDDAV